MKDIEKVSSGKVKYDSFTGKSVIDPTISRFGPYMNEILGISNGNYIDTLLSKKMFSFKISKLSTTDNIVNGKSSDVLYTGYLNKDISFGDIVYITADDIKNEISLYYPIDNRNGNKKVGLICAYFVYSFYNVE